MEFPRGDLCYLSLSNFRGFKKCSASMRPLTILVGPNSSGKSAFFTSLLFLSQSLSQHSFLGVEPIWRSSLIDLGSFKDAIYMHELTNKMEITVGFPKRYFFWNKRKKPPEKREIHATITIQHKKLNPEGVVSRITIKDVTSGSFISFANPWKLSKSIRAPKMTVNINGERIRIQLAKREQPGYYRSSYGWQLLGGIRQHLEANKSNFVGKVAGIKRCVDFFSTSQFELTLSSLSRVSSGRMAPKRFYTTEETKLQVSYSWRGPSLDVYDRAEHFIGLLSEREFTEELWGKEQKRQLVKWLKKLNIASEISDTKLALYHRSINVIDNKSRIKSNLCDVGYGASQILPILYSCLSSDNSPLIIEQPEIHLHPKAQGVVGDLIAATSQKRQIVVETHSVHILNSIRLAILRGDLPSEDVVVHYIDRDASGSKISTIWLNDNADFVGEWPDGFFDERYETTKEILKLKFNKKGK